MPIQTGWQESSVFEFWVYFLYSRILEKKWHKTGKIWREKEIWRVMLRGSKGVRKRENEKEREVETWAWARSVVWILPRALRPVKTTHTRGGFPTLTSTMNPSALSPRAQPFLPFDKQYIQAAVSFLTEEESKRAVACPGGLFPAYSFLFAKCGCLLATLHLERRAVPISFKSPPPLADRNSFTYAAEVCCTFSWNCNSVAL